MLYHVYLESCCFLVAKVILGCIGRPFVGRTVVELGGGMDELHNAILTDTLPLLAWGGYQRPEKWLCGLVYHALMAIANWILPHLDGM